MSFDVKPGERLGIVGATGSGKTTLINLLLRFYDVQRGRILVDGVDIQEMTLADLRGLFSLVLQDVHLFSGRLPTTSVWATPRWTTSVSSAPRARSMPITSLNGCRDAIARRSRSGARAVGGPKQLLSFARALAFEPRILVLDEATSSVDTETELLIRDALETLMAGRTTIAIAHRLSTIQDMDKILVLHKGVVREAGTPSGTARRAPFTSSCSSCNTRTSRFRKLCSAELKVR